MAEVKTRRVKKVTEIPDADVTIEVNQKEEVEPEEVETPKETEEVAETHDVEVPEPKEITTTPEGETVENFEDENSTFSWRMVILIILLAAAIGIALVGGFLYMKKNYNVSVEISKKGETQNLEVPQVSPAPTPEPVDKSAYQIKVLNGSGTAGQAASVQKLLEGGGFTVSGIGNAATQDFTKTQISATEKVSKEYIDELEKTLKKRGAVEVVSAPSDQTEEVVVTVGSDVNATPTPNQ